MKFITIKEMQDLNIGELNKAIREFSKYLFGLKMNNALRSLKNTSEIRKIKRHIARLHTIKSQKHIKLNAKYMISQYQRVLDNGMDV